MILVLGGTTEGRIAVQTLEEAGKPFYYSTKGNEQEVPLHNGIRLQGGMDKDSLERTLLPKSCTGTSVKLLTYFRFRSSVMNAFTPV